MLAACLLPASPAQEKQKQTISKSYSTVKADETGQHLRKAQKKDVKQAGGKARPAQC